MRTLYFLVPGTGGKFACGGLFAELKTQRLAQSICEAAVVTYRQREPETLFLDDVLRSPAAQQAIFVVSWGFHVPKLVARLKGYAVLYHAHSAGYGFRLPPSVPIVAVSRNTMSYWGHHAPNAPIYYLPNWISPEFTNHHRDREIDVLIQTRKSSEYVLKQLIPALQSRCNVVLLDYFVEDIAGLFNRAKVYLYDSAEYWHQRGVTEGFGLPPLEAMACGCQVFSSLNHALSDYLDPSFNCQKIGVYSTEYDVQRILEVVKNPDPVQLPEEYFDAYREAKIIERFRHILTDVNQFFDYAIAYPADVPDFSPLRMARLRLQALWAKLQKKLQR